MFLLLSFRISVLFKYKNKSQYGGLRPPKRFVYELYFSCDDGIQSGNTKERASASASIGSINHNKFGVSAVINNAKFAKKFKSVQKNAKVCKSMGCVIWNIIHIYILG